VWKGPKTKDPETGETRYADESSPLRSCTIITTEANATMEPLHDRMPVLLPASAWEEWLDPTNDDVETLGKLLVPAPPQVITAHPVSTEVNSVRNKGAELIDAIETEVA
jgi:putative SOS response-associated peptidase YedK